MGNNHHSLTYIFKISVALPIPLDKSLSKGSDCVAGSCGTLLSTPPTRCHNSTQHSLSPSTREVVIALLNGESCLLYEVKHTQTKYQTSNLHYPHTLKTTKAECRLHLICCSQGNETWKMFQINLEACQH